MKRAAAVFFGLAVVILCFVGGGLIGSASQAGQEPSYDTAMKTEQYSTQVEILEDGSYRVEERIYVDMLEEKHGIYRYIPKYGPSVYRDGNGEQQKIPYYGKVRLLDANAPADVSTENGCTVFRLGSEDETVYGPVEYEIRYQFTPRFQEKGYSNAYYNVFPCMWQNPIPKGSSFSLVFPKDFDHEALKFYAGAYGSEKDGAALLDLKWSGNTLEGVLDEDLALGEGITFFVDLPEGYFSKMQQGSPLGRVILSLTLLSVVIAAVLFLAFGRDEAIYPSIQYQPPQGLDSAAVGYIIDGAVEDRDMLSLIIYWADQGYLAIEENEKGKIRLHRKCGLPADAPAYAQTMFGKLFEKGDVCKVEKLKGKFYETLMEAKTQVKMCFRGPTALYTSSSRLSRWVSGVLCAVPFGSFLLLVGRTSYTGAGLWIMNFFCFIAFLAGALIVCGDVDSWHSEAAGKREKLMIAGLSLVGIGLAGYGGCYLQHVQDREIFSYIGLYVLVCAASAALVFLTAFMRKRTHVCVEWMGKLLGLRDFIETAELDRLQAMAEETPELFYHILPFAYVMGLSDIFARKLKGLALEPPHWYAGPYGGGYFDYYVFYRSLMRNMDTASASLSVPAQPKGADISTSGGGFSSGGGGGFSGGGFGGGGGGSW